jgi:hypothetical protein
MNNILDNGDKMETYESNMELNELLDKIAEKAMVINERGIGFPMPYKRDSSFFSIWFNFIKKSKKKINKL